MQNNWIDFKALRAQLDFASVLEEYGITVKRKGSQHHGFCPLPNHNGKRNSPSFSAQLERGIFQCFGCGAKGNVLEFAALMENIDPRDGVALRGVALKLQQRFCPNLTSVAPAVDSPGEVKPAPGTNAQGPVVVNPPLDFELKGLDATHPYLVNRSFTTETIALFGLGYCSRGLLRGRIAIPLRDHKGRLIGYAGRLVDDSAITAESPKYKFPPKRERDGKIVEFRKTRFLYNGHGIQAPVNRLIVVEGFTSVWWLVQNGFLSVVATMGADCSERQAELICQLIEPGGLVQILSDGDEAGQRCAESIFRNVAPSRAVRWLKLEQSKQPTDLSKEMLAQLLG